MNVHVYPDPLLAACVAGDKESCRLLLTPYLDQIKGIFCRLQPDQAEDLLHDFFIKLVSSIRQFVPGTNLGAWLYKIATSIALDSLRKKRVSLVSPHTMLPNLPASGAAPLKQLIQSEVSAVLWQCVDSLEQHEAFFFRRRYALGEDPRETAMFFVDEWIDTAPLSPGNSMSKPEKNSANAANRQTLKNVVAIPMDRLPPVPDGSVAQKNCQDQASEKISGITRDGGECMARVKECMSQKGMYP